ncbi:hypothetical protein [Halocynthiibacter sp.]|uniref:hypothetical protein n=1 Tax=Halocynthiibacter sp. TaxID=1979210 RepID=UPI003C3C4C9D
MSYCENIPRSYGTAMIRKFFINIAVLTATSSFLATAAFADHCDGQYQRAQHLLDQTYSRYGTLYSGGYYNGSVGGSLEIYRLLSGLPDAGMTAPHGWQNQRSFTDPAYLSRYGQSAAKGASLALMRNLPRISDPDFQRDTETTKTDPEIILNNLSPSGPWPGWWLTPDALGLSAVERVIARYAFDDALNWLLTVQNASVHSDNDWHIRSRHGPSSMASNHRVWRHALQMFSDNGQLTWFVAAWVNRAGYNYLRDHVSEDVAHQITALREHQDTLGKAVESCNASEDEYTAWAIARLEQLRLSTYSGETPKNMDLLPDHMRDIAAVHQAQYLISNPRRGDNAESNLQALQSLATNQGFPHERSETSFASWLNAGRSYRANDIQELIDIHAGVPLHSTTWRLLNVLSVDDLVRFSASRTDFPGEQRNILQVAFLRLYALKRDEEALDLIPRLAELWSEDERFQLTAPLQSSAPLEWQLTQVAQLLPHPSLRLGIWHQWEGWYGRNQSPETWAHRRTTPDLPLPLRIGEELRNDLDRWLTQSPVLRHSPQRRQQQRGYAIIRPATGLLPHHQADIEDNPAGISGFAAWDEISRLGPETGLSNRIGHEIILNAQRKTSNIVNRLWANDEALAADLRNVIWQARRMKTGNMEGRPLGQVAFRLLHKRFPETDAARQTPYWYICQWVCIR